MKRVTVITLAAMLCATACSSNVDHAMAAATNTGYALGATAPAFDAEALDSDATLHSTDYRGKIVVLNFWATWCPPCRAETPEMVRAYAHLHAPDVAFVGLDTTESAGVVKSFVALKGIPYQIALAKPTVYNDYGISYIPTTIVLDANGIVRARWTGGITPAQLKAYIASARAGKTSTVSTPQQAKIDTMLAPSHFVFAGNAAAQQAAIKIAQARIDASGTYVDNLKTNQYDFERTNHETGTAELAVANATASLAKTPVAHVAADRLLAAAYGSLNRYPDAITVEKAALALQPNSAELVGALTTSYYRLHDYSDMLAEATVWTKLAPKDSDAWDQVGEGNQRLGKYADAVPAYKKTLALMIADAKTKPIGKDGEAVADVADESLDFANIYVSLGDPKDAQAIFNQANAYAKLIPPASVNAELKTIVPERTIEGMTAASMVHGNSTTIALGPWTGGDLPGSMSTGIRYRLVAVAPADRVVSLYTKGLRDGWIASFCQDRLCSPNKVTFTMPPTGIKTYEFQLIPPTENAKPGAVSVGGNGTNWVDVPSV